MTSRFPIVLGMTALLTALLGAVWFGLQVIMISMTYGAGAGGNPVSQQHISLTVFIGPALALVLGVTAFISRRHAASHQTSIWLLVPAVALAVLTILFALTAL